MPTNRASSLSPENPLLGLLRLEPGHGYQVHQRLERDLGSLWTVRQNQAYNILKRLEAAGLVHATRGRGKGAHAQRRLSLTPAGRRRFDAWLRTPTGLSARALRVDFLTRLYFAQRLDPELAHAIIDGQLAVTRDGVDRLCRRNETGHPPGLVAELSDDLRMRHLKLVIEWLESLRERIEGPAPS
jgi:DNA-binding PadR family transcriptional regulator